VCLVWFSEDKRTVLSFFFFFLEQPWPPLSLTDAAGVVSNKKPFVGNLSLFFNKMLARVGSIFKAHICSRVEGSCPPPLGHKVAGVQFKLK
jgi:hypothetical protein